MFLLKGHSQLCDCADLDSSFSRFEKRSPKPENKVHLEIHFNLRSVLKSNCLPLPSLFFRDCSYSLNDINRQTATVTMLNQFVKTSQIHNYKTRSVSSESFYVKFSRTDKMYTFLSRIGTQIWNSIPYSFKLLKRSSFRKKITKIIAKFLAV